MVDHAPPQVRQDPAPDTDTDTVAYSSDYTSGGGANMSSMDGVTPAYATDPSTMVCETPQAVGQQLADTSAPLTDGPQSQSQISSGPLQSLDAQTNPQGQMSTVPSATLQSLPGDQGASDPSEPGTATTNTRARGTGTGAGRRRRGQPRQGGGPDQTVAELKPLGPIAHPTLEFGPEEALPSTSPNVSLKVPDPPMATAADITAEAPQERAKIRAARTNADTEFKALCNRVAAAHSARAASQVQIAQQLRDAHNSARATQQLNAREVDRFIEQDALAADGALQFVADTARQTIQMQYAQARRRVGGAKSHALTQLTQADSAARATIGTLAAEYAGVFAAEVERFARLCIDDERVAVQNLTAYIGTIDGERLGNATQGAGERMIAVETRKGKVKPEAVRLKTVLQRQSAEVVLRLNTTRNDVLRTMPPPLIRQLGQSATATKRQITGNINKAAKSAFSALRKQRDQALEAIDQQENQARDSVRTQRNVARQTLENQANTMSARNRQQAQAALQALDGAAKAAGPAQNAALTQLRGTLAQSALAPAPSLRKVTSEAVSGAGESMRIADIAQRRQQETVRTGATDGILKSLAKAGEDRAAFVQSTRTQLQMMPTATRQGMDKTVASTNKANIAAAKSVAKVGDGTAKIYEEFIGKPGADGSGTSVRDQLKTAQTTNMPGYKESLKEATKGFRDSTKPYATVDRHPAIAGKFQSERQKSIDSAATAREKLREKLDAYDSCLFFNLSEADAVPSAVRGLSKGQARYVRDEPNTDFIAWVRRSLGRTRNARATIHWLRGQRVLAAAAELEAAEGIINDDEARAEAALRVLSPEELREMATSQAYSVRRGRELARSYLGGDDLAVVNALFEGNYARADAIRYIEGLRQSANTRTFGARVSFVQRFTGAPPDTQWGGQQVTEGARRLQVAREVAQLRNPNATTPVSDQAALDTMADMASGRWRYQVRGRGGTTTERTGTRYQGARNDLLRDSVLHGNTSAEVRAARVGIAIETHPGRPVDMTSLELGLVDDRLNPNNYPPTMTVPAAVREQAIADRDRLFQISYERYGGQNMSTGDAAVAQARIRDQLVARMGRNKVGAGLVRGMADEPWPSPQTAALAWEYALQNSTDRSNLVFRFSDRMSQTEIDSARATYRSNTGRHIYDDLGLYGHGHGFSAFSGKERMRAERSFRGMARTDQEKSLAAIFALRQQLNESGSAGRAMADRSETGQQLARELARLEGVLGPVSFTEGRANFTDSNNRFNEQGQFLGNEMDIVRFRAGLAGASQTAKSYQGLIDHYAAQASMAITAIGVIAAVAVTIATGGAAAPLLMAGLAAGAGLAGMAAKRAIRGGGYGWEEAGIDLAMTALDALTAGVGQKLGLASRGGAAAMRAASGATVRQQMTGAANRAIMRNMGADAVRQGARLTGTAIGDKLLIGAVTGGMGGLGRTALDSNTWREGAEQGSFNRLFEGLAVGVGTGVISSAISHGIEAAPGPNANFGAFGSGVMSGLSNAGGGFSGTASQLFYDHAQGRYRGDFGAGFLQALQEGGKGGLQGFVEGVGSKVRSDRDEARVAADPDLNELPGVDLRSRAERENSQADPTDTGSDVVPPISDIADTPAPNAPGPVPTDADGLPRVPGLGDGTASAIDGSLMRGDFAPTPVIDTTHVTKALGALGEPGGVFGPSLRKQPGDDPMVRRIETGVDGKEPVKVRIRVRDPGDDVPPAVARFVDAPDGDGMIIEVSNRAHPLVVERALAHEISEIRGLARDRAVNNTSEPHAGGAARRQLDPHERGRLAEFEVLARQIATETNPDQKILLQQEAHHLAMDLIRLGGDSDATARLQLLGDAMETPQGRALLDFAHQQAGDNPFVRTLDGTEVAKLEVFQERLKIAQALDAVLGGNDRARSVLNDAMYVDGLMQFNKIVGVSEVNLGKFRDVAPHLSPILDSVLAHVQRIGFQNVPRPGVPLRPAEYKYGSGLSDVAGMGLDPSRPLRSHALDDTGLSPTIQNVGQLLAAREQHRLEFRRLDALIKTNPPQPQAVYDARSQAHGLRNRAAEALGEVAARRIAEGMEATLGGPLRELTVSGRGSAMTDLVFEVTSGPNQGRIIVIEAKGGRSRLLYRLNRSQSAKVEQGNREYLRTVADLMAGSSKPENKAVGRRIIAELDSRRPNIEYHHVKQPIRDGATTLPLPQQAQFDVGGRPRAPAAGWGDDTSGTAAVLPGTHMLHAHPDISRGYPATSDRVRAAISWMKRDNIGVAGQIVGDPRVGDFHTSEVTLRIGNEGRTQEIVIQPVSWQDIPRLAESHGVDISAGLPAAFYGRVEANGVRRIFVSDRLNDVIIPRAIAHELAEIRGLYDPVAAPMDVLRDGGPAMTFGSDDQPNLSPHDRGRLAELDVMIRQVPILYATGQRANAVRVTREIRVLLEHLGGFDPSPAGQARQRFFYERMLPHTQVGTFDTIGVVTPGSPFRRRDWQDPPDVSAVPQESLRHLLISERSGLANEFLQAQMNQLGLSADTTIPDQHWWMVQAQGRAEQVENAARVMLDPNTTQTNRAQARTILETAYPQLMQDLRGRTIHLGHLRDIAQRVGLPEATVFDLSRSIPRTSNGQQLSEARESLEVFLWDIFHNRREGHIDQMYSIYQEYSQSRRHDDWTAAGIRTHRTLSRSLIDRFPEVNAYRNGMYTLVQGGRGTDNFYFLHAYNTHQVDQRAAVTQRIYLRLKTDTIAPAFQWFVNHMLTDRSRFDGVFGGKIAGVPQGHARAESMVIYLTKDADVNRIALALFQAGGDGLRREVSATTPMTDVVLPGVRTAIAPSEGLINHQRALTGDPEMTASFGETRANAIQAAMQDPTTTDFDSFLANTLREMLRWGIDPDNPSQEMGPWIRDDTQ